MFTERGGTRDRLTSGGFRSKRRKIRNAIATLAGGPPFNEYRSQS
jgi:hypothetical protein